MTVTIQCRTLFDITATGVRNHTSGALRPFQDQAGQVIENDQHWVRSRNQQRNWDTVNQILALRTLPERITEPIMQHQETHGRVWHFEFDIPDLAAVSQGDDWLALLRSDADQVPMITDLGETAELAPMLCSTGDSINIWFAVTS